MLIFIYGGNIEVHGQVKSRRDHFSLKWLGQDVGNIAAIWQYGAFAHKYLHLLFRLEVV
jgi:hypothetical protein